MSYAVACHVDQLVDDEPLVVIINGVGIALVQTGGEIFAIQNLCSHAAEQLAEGEVSEHSIECPRHGSRFDLRGGCPLDLPATEPVPVFPVRVEGDEVLVDISNSLDPQCNDLQES